MKAQRRFTKHFKTGKSRVNLRPGHPAYDNATTIFKSRVFDVDDHVLKSGINQRKIGSHVTKGKWAGMPIFTLTLEERATCPTSCQHWDNCYGNNLHLSKRYKHGPELEAQLDKEITELSKKYPDGFVIRPHILGDFYSVDYVMRWYSWMYRFPNLHVFGYSAWWAGPIGDALEDARIAFPDRWWVRYSHKDKETWYSTGDTGIICPVQTGGTDCCGECGLCWTAEKPIQFLVH